ncbi:MAG: hypothetical protein ACOC1P_00620 [Minisyncoccales bacterium]
MTFTIIPQKIELNKSVDNATIKYNSDKLQINKNIMQNLAENQIKTLLLYNIESLNYDDYSNGQIDLFNSSSGYGNTVNTDLTTYEFILDTAYSNQITPSEIERTSTNSISPTSTSNEIMETFSVNDYLDKATHKINCYVSTQRIYGSLRINFLNGSSKTSPESYISSVESKTITLTNDTPWEIVKSVDFLARQRGGYSAGRSINRTIYKFPFDDSKILCINCDFSNISKIFISTDENIKFTINDETQEHNTNEYISFSGDINKICFKSQKLSYIRNYVLFVW